MVKIHHFGAIYVSIPQAMKPLRATHGCSCGRHTQVFVGDTECRERKCQVWGDGSAPDAEVGVHPPGRSNGQMVKW